MCRQESKLYLEARDWLLWGTQRGDKSRELVLPGGHLTTKHIWASLIASGKEEREQSSGSVQGAESTKGSFYVNLGPRRPAPNITGGGNKSLEAARPQDRFEKEKIYPEIANLRIQLCRLNLH